MGAVNICCRVTDPKLSGLVYYRKRHLSFMEVKNGKGQAGQVSLRALPFGLFFNAFGYGRSELQHVGSSS